MPHKGHFSHLTVLPARFRVPCSVLPLRWTALAAIVLIVLAIAQQLAVRWRARQVAGWASVVAGSQAQLHSSIHDEAQHGQS